MMYNNFFSGTWSNMWSQGSFMHGWFAPWVLIAFAWTLVWKGLALWKSARRGENVWFVVLLVVNTLGVLDILYLYIFSKKFKPVK